MKRLSKLKLHEVVKLSDSEMKSIRGGYYSVDASNCSTTCPDGTVLEITNCNGTCTADKNYSVTCKGATQTLTKTCSGYGSYNSLI